MPSLPRRTAGRTPMRRAAAIVSALALTLAAAGCAASPENGQDTPQSAADGFPVTIQHQYGSTTVPDAPERVVVVGITEQDILLQLGIAPVATTSWLGAAEYEVYPWAEDLLGGAQPEVLSTSDGFEFERIVALQPDLIVGTNAGLTEEDYEKLSAIAPTVTGVEGAEAYFSDWRDQTRQIAAAVGQAEKGEQIIAEVETSRAEARAAHPEFEGLTVTFSQGEPVDGSLWVDVDSAFTDALSDLGFASNPRLEQFVDDTVAGSKQVPISAENVDQLDADVIVFATESPQGLERLLGFGSIAQLDAVAGGHAVFTPPLLASALYFNTPLSNAYILDHIVPLLSQAVDGTAPQDIGE